MSENDFECFASTGVNTPVAMSPNSGCHEVQLSASLLDGLLGYPPEDRSQRRSRTGEMFLRDSCSGLGILCGYLAGRTGRKHNLGQPEVQNLRVAALGHENVGGLDVAMGDSFGA